VPWLQVTFTADRGRAPLIEAALQSAGALAVTLADAGDDPQLEPPPGATPLWDQVSITALFPDDASSRTRAQSLAHRLGIPARFEPLGDRAWERVWLDDFAPARFGRRLWVCPRGQRTDDPGAVVVELDPGLAFGTGHHATTALCLTWLDACDLSGATLIDYGCGSGILAIAALRLGASRVIAVDHDPQAREAAAANAGENAVAERLLVCPPEAVPKMEADVLVANILAGPLIELAPRLTTLVRPGGRLALSGILDAQSEAVAAAYAEGFELDPPLRREDWVLLVGRRGPDPAGADASRKDPCP
jgi:ribosomal protein L11 methyltransferase